MKRTFAGVGTIVLLSCLTVSGQLFAQAPGPALVFIAADVHPSKPGVTESDIEFLAGGRLVARAASMLNLIHEAYGIETEMILGGPNWLDDRRFDINAKAAPTTDEATMRSMLQSLLADRFKLVIHKDQKAVPSYALTVGKRGLKLKESVGEGSTDCSRTGGGPANVILTCQHMAARELAQTLRGLAAGYLDHPVIDMTGLKGTYDFTLTWTPKNRLRPSTGDSDQATGISIFDAIDKQLGLKAELTKGPVPVVVIESVNETPTGNPASVTSSLPKESTEFEVADVRASAPGSKKMDVNLLPGGRLDVKGVTLKFLLNFAYQTDYDMIFGPKWLDTDNFDIIAKASKDLSQAEYEVMVRSLLADRFKLKVHNEDRPVDVYALVVGKRGSKLKEPSGEVRANCKTSAGDGKKNYICQNTTMAQLADKLRGQAGAYIDHPVVNLTGLKGAYDFTLSWTPKGQFQAATGRVSGDASAGGAAPVAEDPNGALTVFEAIEKQLGLRLEVQKHPMPVVVVDSAERTPTGN